ncbi:MAG: hypothetical protein ACI3ZL_07550 [Candidatus Cryptobacteroides sp.]
MKRIISILAVAAAIIIAAGCTKEARKVSVERQWAGVIVAEEDESISFCIDLGVTAKDSMTIAIKAGDILNGLDALGNINWDDINLGDLVDLGSLGNLGDLTTLLKLIASINSDDFIYADMTSIPYTLTYTGKDTGNITFTAPGIGGSTMTAEFWNLTTTSVTVSLEGEEMTLTVTDKKLIKINDSIFKMFF